MTITISQTTPLFSEKATAAIAWQPAFGNPVVLGVTYEPCVGALVAQESPSNGELAYHRYTSVQWQPSGVYKVEMESLDPDFEPSQDDSETLDIHFDDDEVEIREMVLEALS